VTGPGPAPDGPLMFVRYAYPPNALGYCGPDGFADYAAAGVVDQGLVRQARAFSGAWPYLELIAAGCGIPDPLDHRVAEAYWVGNDLLDRVGLAGLGDSLADRFPRHRRRPRLTARPRTSHRALYPLMSQPQVETFRARTMIVSSFGGYVPVSAHDHETAR